MAATSRTMRNPRGIVWCPHCTQPHHFGDTICATTGRAITSDLHRTAIPAHPLVGTVLDGKYRIREVIGEGGLGIVFDAENIRMRRDVAVKLVKDTSSSASAVERLHREARIVASLQHPNICDVYDFGVAPPYGPYLVTQRLQGSTIAARFKWQRNFRVRESIEIVAQILSGLHVAHAQQIVHRDVTPRNVFLVERVGCTPVAKILDFGLAKDLTWATPLTMPGKAIGTPSYMAPEQLAAKPVTRATDIFSTGVLIYEMVTGRHPFAAKTTADVQARVLREPPSPMLVGTRRAPDALEAVVFRALEKSPGSRWPDAYAMQQALLEVHRSLESDGSLPPTPLR
jgi:eukaryotic-like serine/threonine-protein kinase